MAPYQLRGSGRYYKIMMRDVPLSVKAKVGV